MTDAVVNPHDLIKAWQTKLLLDDMREKIAGDDCTEEDIKRYADLQEIYENCKKKMDRQSMIGFINLGASLSAFCLQLLSELD